MCDYAGVSLNCCSLDVHSHSTASQQGQDNQVLARALSRVCAASAVTAGHPAKTGFKVEQTISVPKWELVSLLAKDRGGSQLGYW